MEKSDLLNQLRIDRSAPAARSGTRTPLVLGVVLAVLVVAGVAAYFLGRDPALVVETAVARSLASQTTQASVLDATGYITARRLATVSAKITGRVQTVLIEEGMRVEQGQVLATLEDVDAKAQRALGAARLESARSQLAEIRTNLANAEREAERQQGLAERKLVSVQAIDAANTQAAALRGRLASAQREVQVAERSLQILDLDVDNTIVRAPFSGVITVKAAQPGEIISPLSAGGGFTRTGIGTIVDMDSLEIEVDVNENFIGRVQPAQPVEATLNAYPDWKIPGRGHRHHPHRRPQQGHGQGAHRDQAQGRAHRARHGRAGRFSRRKQSGCRTDRAAERRAGSQGRLASRIRSRRGVCARRRSPAASSRHPGHAQRR